tara:strand:- start:7053 stop:7319 length:267 start_codon:yes stop_codon:yes gene_type:complete
MVKIKQSEVKIDFDKASRAWRMNKKQIGPGIFTPSCTWYSTKNKYCKNKINEYQNKYCKFHSKINYKSKKHKEMIQRRTKWIEFGLIY